MKLTLIDKITKNGSFIVLKFLKQLNREQGTEHIMKIEVIKIKLGGIIIPFFVTIEVKKVVGEGKIPFAYIPETAETSIEELKNDSLNVDQRKSYTVSILSGNQVGSQFTMSINTELIENVTVICFTSVDFDFYTELVVSKPVQV